MSHFAFPRDQNGNILVTDQSAAEAMEILINQLMLLNERVEEAFETQIDQEDTDNDS